ARYLAGKWIECRKSNVAEKESDDKRMQFFLLGIFFIVRPGIGAPLEKTGIVLRQRKADRCRRAAENNEIDPAFPVIEGPGGNEDDGREDGNHSHEAEDHFRAQL